MPCADAVSLVDELSPPDQEVEIITTHAPALKSQLATQAPVSRLLSVTWDG